jgi:hypothetical protein
MADKRTFEIRLKITHPEPGEVMWLINDLARSAAAHFGMDPDWEAPGEFIYCTEVEDSTNAWDPDDPANSKEAREKRFQDAVKETRK